MLKCGILPTQYAVDFYGWDGMKSSFGNNYLLRDLRYVLVYSINSQKSFEVVQVLFFFNLVTQDFVAGV